MKRIRPMQNRGELAVVAVCVVVGFLLAAQLRGVQLAGAADATNASRLETLQSLYNERGGGAGRPDRAGGPAPERAGALPAAGGLRR